MHYTPVEIALMIGLAALVVQWPAGLILERATARRRRRAVGR